VILFEVLFNGVVVGGIYSLIAMGLNLQYGVARIVNLAYGEILMLAAYASFFLFTAIHFNPLLSLFVTAGGAFALNWLFYRLMLRPLIKRALSQLVLEGDTLLLTFGLLFVIEGSAFLFWGGDLRSYGYLQAPIDILGVTFQSNRLIAFLAACVVGIGSYCYLRYTRVGTAVRALAVDPAAAELVAIHVARYSAIVFAIGGALAAASGTLLSMFISFNPTTGIVYTLKALIVIVMGGVGNMMGSLVAGLILGVAESLGAHFVDPGLTLAINYAIFILVLLVRPSGLFARA
jgi:branched-chain amino acid transport system permease protein